MIDYLIYNQTKQILINAKLYFRDWVLSYEFYGIFPTFYEIIWIDFQFYFNLKNKKVVYYRTLT